MKKITDPTFRYVPSHETDIAKTFARLRAKDRELKKERDEKVVGIGTLPIRTTKFK